MSRLMHLLRRHRYLVFLLVSGLLVPLVTELAGSWLEATIGRTPSRLIQLLAICVALAVALWALYLALGKQKPLELVPREQRPTRFPGLIVLIGPGKEGADPQSLSHNPAIEYHLSREEAGGEPLRACWLIATAGEKGSVPVAMEVQQRYGGRCEVIIETLKDAFDLEETYQLIQRIYVQRAVEKGLAPDQIIADFTGGTKPMSAGMVLACREECWPMQYMTGGRKDIASVPIFVRFTPAR
ncbi:MAG: hypothetical protein SWK90_17280 [Chloroflexota bacterium]|nr:hypothetical protein [Chloroflexota bacterium]